ncbi:MAG: Gfo/Idh/MocA family oxidoreductase [Phycisphaerales bacterium]|nr:MAG: Gfo/Idh/MocA family oxidoreductase [Phycisphaerales bacterium]
MSKRRISRRRFFSRVGLGAAGLLILKEGRSARGTPANEKINVALIGVGGRGTWFVDTIPRMENVVAVCDVNEQKIAEAYKRWASLADRFAASSRQWEKSAAPAFRRLADEKVPAFADFREMLDKMQRQIDAVVVSTPDHTHAVASAAAIRAGKHVFCEKPLTRTLHESRALRELAGKFGVATSMGNQGTASGQFRRALELIRDGTLGRIKEVHIWNTGGGGDRKRPPAQEPVPEHLNWDLWLGPAKFRPYHRDWTKRNLWRDFGTCQLGNWASHSANLAFMALKVQELWLAKRSGQDRAIVRVKAKSSGINRLSFPRWEVVTWEIPARAEFPPITFTWHNGAAPGSREAIEGLLGDSGWGENKQMDHAGAIIAGTEGTIHATGHNATFRLLPAERFRNVEKGRPKTVDRSRGHEMDWFIACRGGKAAWANFDYASALNEFLMLGNVATQFEEGLDFDPAAMRIVNNAEADALLRPEYRRGWSL